MDFLHQKNILHYLEVHTSQYAFIDVIATFAFVFAFLFLSFSLGNFLLKKINPSALPTLGNTLSSILLGNFLYSLIPTLFATLSIASEKVVAIGFLVLSIFAASLSSSSFKQAFDLIKRIPLYWNIFLLPVYLALPLCFLPPNDWDTLSYHLAAPLEVFARGHFYFPESLTPFNFPLLPQMIFSIPLSLGLPYAAPCLNLSMLLISTLFTFELGSSLASKKVGILAVALFLSHPLLFEVAITSRIDCFTLAYFLGAIYCACGNRNSSILLALVFGSCSFTSKYTAGLILAFSLPYLFYSSTKKSTPSLPAVIISLILISCNAIWFIKNQYLHDEALFPISVTSKGVSRAEPKINLNGLTYSIFALNKEPTGNAQQLSDEALILVKDLVFAANKATTKAHFLSLENILDQRKISRKPGEIIHIHAFISLLLFPVLFLIGQTTIGILLLSCVAYIVALSFFVSQSRYLIITLPFASLALSSFIVWSCSAFNKRRAALLVFVIILAATYSSSNEVIKKWDQKQASCLFDKTCRPFQYLQSHGINGTRNELFTIYEKLKDEEVRTILMIGSPHVISHPSIPDYEQLGRYAISWLRLKSYADVTGQSISEVINHKNITHIIIPWGYFQWVLKNAEVKNPTLLINTLKDIISYIDRHGEVILKENNTWLVKVRLGHTSEPELNNNPIDITPASSFLEK